jgi:hypothetical protein
MNIKTKVTISIVITLIIGVVIGAMLNRALVQRRITRAFALSNPKTFSLWYENRLGLDPEQARQIKSILDKHSESIWEIREEFMQEMQTASQELHSELEPLLTPRQKRQLDRGPFSPRRDRSQNFRPLLPGGPGPKPGGVPGNREILDALSLTEEQVNQLRSQAQRQFRTSTAARRRLQDPENMLLLWLEQEKQRDAALEKILNEDQKKIYAGIKKVRRQKLIALLEKLTQID